MAPIEAMELPAGWRLLRSHGAGSRRRWVLARLGRDGTMTPIREWSWKPSRAEVVGAVTENGGLREGGNDKAGQRCRRSGNS